MLKVFPLGKSPIITDTGVDGKENVTLAESGAIVEYLIKTYANGKFSGGGGQQYIDNLYFTHYAEGSIMPLMVMRLIFTIIPQRSPWFLRWLLNGVFAKVTEVMVKPELKKHSELVEKHLEDKEYFAGGSELTSADFLMIFPVEVLEYMDMAGPKTKEYVKKIHERPTYKTALEKGGEYTWAKL
ncbi:hypothetical protein PQX77_017740 [Marasmius sp. AFHP31]|nr:hypothetical protein PQX77_017740 [Marasmius sp. AFHP31]